MTTVTIGHTFIALKEYPRIAQETAIKEEDFSYDINVGEKCLIKYFDGVHYTIWNLSLDADGLAWVNVTEEELTYLCGTPSGNVDKTESIQGGIQNG